MNQLLNKNTMMTFRAAAAATPTEWVSTEIRKPLVRFSEKNSFFKFNKGSSPNEFSLLKTKMSNTTKPTTSTPKKKYRKSPAFKKK